jgi:hypothetical protein
MTSNLPQYIANSRKAIIQVCTLVITLGTFVVTFQQLPDKYATLITTLVGLAGTIVHYATPNAPAPGTGTAEDPFVITDLEDDVPVTDDMKPAELVTASQVDSSLSPEETPAAEAEPTAPPAP